MHSVVDSSSILLRLNSGMWASAIFAFITLGCSPILCTNARWVGKSARNWHSVCIAMNWDLRWFLSPVQPIAMEARDEGPAYSIHSMCVMNAIIAHPNCLWLAQCERDKGAVRENARERTKWLKWKLMRFHLLDWRFASINRMQIVSNALAQQKRKSQRNSNITGGWYARPPSALRLFLVFLPFTSFVSLRFARSIVP